MSDDEKRRPNANYKLSRDNDDPEIITYYYNRENRLAKAPRAIQDLYQDLPVKRGGFLRTFIRRRPRSMTFFSIMLCCILLVIASNVTSAAKTHNIDGNQLSVQAAKYDGVMIVGLRKKAGTSMFSRRSPAYTGAVDITVSPAEAKEESFNHRVIFSRERQERFSFVVPFESDELLLIFQTEKNTIEITINAE